MSSCQHTTPNRPVSQIQILQTGGLKSSHLRHHSIGQKPPASNRKSTNLHDSLKSLSIKRADIEKIRNSDIVHTKLMALSRLIRESRAHSQKFVLSVGNLDLLETAKAGRCEYC